VNNILRTAFGFFTILLVFCLSWALGLVRTEWGAAKSLFILLVTAHVPVPFYLYLRSLKNPPFGWKLGACLLVGLTVFGHSAMQTDQLRYILDGLQTLRGINPFRYTPQETFEKFGSLGILSQINHPHLSTVYPPLAQFFFAVSSFLNPFVWPFVQTVTPLKEGFAENLFPLILKVHKMAPPSVYWYWEFGLRVATAFCVFGMIRLQKHKRWDLLVFHPLFLFCVCLNLHIDALSIWLVLLLFHHSFSKKKEHFLLSASILVRWLSVLFLPFFALRWWKKEAKTDALSQMFLVVALVVLAFSFYSVGSNGNLFRSSGAYVQHWFFFGFLHRWLVDFFAFLKINDSIFWAKIFCAGAFLFSYVFVFIKFWKHKLTLRLSCTLVYLFFLICTPTIHPWYLLPLLALGLPYSKTLYTVWVWPMLSLLSYSFYFLGKDPFLVRNVVYILVSLLLWLDLKRIFAQKATFPCSP
jgi:alpha-1,6-mannosyltransferase